MNIYVESMVCSNVVDHTWIGVLYSEYMFSQRKTILYNVRTCIALYKAISQIDRLLTITLAKANLTTVVYNEATQLGEGELSSFMHA